MRHLSGHGFAPVAAILSWIAVDGGHRIRLMGPLTRTSVVLQHRC